MKKKSLGIMLTNRCNANCAMCGLSCSPQKNDVIDEKLLLKAIDEAKTVNIKRIGFSGGEAFLYPELLIKGSNYAKEKGFTVTVATNGFWGLWSKEKIDKILSKASLDDVYFSIDAFHQEYVSLEAIRGAIAACRRCSIPCSVSIGEAKGKYDAADFIRSLGDTKYYTDMHIYPFYRVGKAKSLPADVFYPLRPVPPRCYDSSALGMRCDGLVYPCCSPAAFDTCLSFGNLKERSLSDMLKENPCVDIFILLHDSESFQKLMDIAIQKGILAEADKALAPCVICNLMFGEKGYGILQKDAANLYDELLIKRLFAN